MIYPSVKIDQELLLTRIIVDKKIIYIDEIIEGYQMKLTI